LFSSLQRYLYQFKPWSTTCYAAADVCGAPCHNINVPAVGIPNLDIPRLQDLLSEPIDDLTGPHRERVRGFFSEFDHTLSQNKRSIENSIANIVRAQFLDDLPMFKFPGKRLTKKPSKFYSPFKHGILSRPPPNLEFSLRMHAFLCADDSPLKRFILISFFSFHTPECLLNSIQENFDALWDRVIDWPRYYTFLWYWEIHRPCVHGCICQMHSRR